MKDAPEFVTMDEVYGDIASKIIEDKRKDILAAGIAVGFVGSNRKKVKARDHVVCGECKKVPDLYKLYCPYDFLIIIYEENCTGFTDRQMEILLWHELLHIGIDDKGKAYLRDHDVEEFDDIIRDCGLRWNR